jgi:hypothetical protein
MDQISPWELFKRAQSKEDMRLFRLLQRIHTELPKGRQMFYLDYLNQKKDIEDYVLDKFGVDLNNLPKDFKK